MADDELHLRRFSFQRRPIPVPGDLRIGWRVALILLMLGHSRSSRASLAKLHILNDAIRSDQQQRLRAVVSQSGAAFSLPWTLRVEPAFARAIDFVVGEKFAAWTKVLGRAALQLTAAGIEAFKALSELDDALVAERGIIAEFAKAIPEGTVTNLLGEGRNVA